MVPFELVSLDFLKSSSPIAHSFDVAIQLGVAVRAGEKRAIASSMPKNVCPRQGRFMPTPRSSAAGPRGVTTF